MTQSPSSESQINLAVGGDGVLAAIIVDGSSGGRQTKVNRETSIDFMFCVDLSHLSGSEPFIWFSDTHHLYSLALRAPHMVQRYALFIWSGATRPQYSLALRAQELGVYRRYAPRGGSSLTDDQRLVIPVWEQWKRVGIKKRQHTRDTNRKT